MRASVGAVGEIGITEENPAAIFLAVADRWRRRWPGRLGSMLRHNPTRDAALLDFHCARKLGPLSAAATEWISALSCASGKADALVSAIRLGDCVSEHTLLVAGAGERTKIVHKAQSFDARVSGALATLRLPASHSPGAYTFADVLDIPATVTGGPQSGPRNGYVAIFCIMRDGAFIPASPRRTGPATVLSPTDSPPRSSPTARAGVRGKRRARRQSPETRP